MSRVQRGLIGGVVCAAVLAGCGQRGEANDPPPVIAVGPTSVATTSVTPTSPPPARPKAPSPADRDRAAVSAALTGLDACALLDQGRSKLPGLRADATLDPLAPHNCLLSATVGGTRASLKLGEELGPAERYSAELLTVAGAKVYFRYGGMEKGPSPEVESCWLAIPVSFEDVIELNVDLITRTERLAFCRRAAIEVATPVIRALATPEDFRNRLPNAHRDACVVLAEVLHESVSAPGLVHWGGVDGCKQIVGKGGIGLFFHNFQMPDHPDRMLRIGGKAVAESSLFGCELAWSDGPSGVPGRVTGLRIVELRVDLEEPMAARCNRAAALAPVAMRTLSKPTLAAAVPQRPLTYKPADPDVAAAGACLDLWQPHNCAPYKPVAAPRGAAEVLRRVRADPNASCAIAIQAVREQLGPGFRPVTDRRRNEPNGPYECAFVEAAHGLTVWIRVHPPKPGYTVYPTLTVGGLPAHTQSTTLSGEGERKLRHDTLVVDVTKQIQLSVVFEFGEPRGPLTRPPLEGSRLTRLRQVATGIVTSSLR